MGEGADVWQQGTRLPVVCVPKLRSVWSDTHRPASGVAEPQPRDLWGKPAGSPALLGGSDKVGENFLSGGFACEPCLSQCRGGSFIHPFTVAPPAAVCQVLGSSDGQASGASDLGGKTGTQNLVTAPPAASVRGQLSEAC